MNQQQFFEHDESLQMTSPNYIGSRNRFFLFMTILKNSQYSTMPFSIFSLFADLINNMLCSVYPLIPFIVDKVSSDNHKLDLFPNDLPFFLPKVIITDFLLLVSFSIMFFTILTFLICFFDHTLIIRWHWLINPQIHFILLPFNSLAFGFCPFALIDNGDFSEFIRIFLILNMIMFPIYCGIACVLFCFDTNSIMRPNPIFAEWFYGSSIFLPLLKCFQAIFNTIGIRVSEKYEYALEILLAVMHLAYLIFILYKMPFILILVDQIIATNCLFTVFMNIFTIVVIAFVRTSLGAWYFSLIPVLYTLMFMIIYLISDRRRQSMYQFLQQFDASVGDFTVDAIRMTLTSYHSEHSIQWIIRDCFLSANKHVLSQRFLQYCLQIYPKSQWLLSAVTFIYTMVWSNNPALYRILLHLSSLDKFGAIPAFIMYQCVYCLMQSSKDEVSPIIKRDVAHYRRTMAIYAEYHLQFWSSAANYDFNKFSKSISKVVNCNKQLRDELECMLIKYPYCPTILLEASLYYSDIRHDFKKSANSFKKYTELAEGNESVSRQLFLDFFNLFPISRPLSETLHIEKKKRVDSDLIFVSFNEKQEHASRTMLPPFKDSYYSLCQAFSMPKHKKLFDINLDRTKLLAYKASFALSAISYIVLFVFYFVFMKKLIEKTDVYKTRVSYIESSLEFRKSTILCFFNSMIMYNFHMKTYNVTVDDGFNEFILRHLHSSYDGMLKYKYLINNEEKVMENTNYYLPNCRSLNCTFSYIFGYMHNIVQYYNDNAKAFEISQNHSPEQLNISVHLMLQLADHLYTQFAFHHVNGVRHLYHYISDYVKILLTLEVLSLIIYTIIMKIIEKSLFRNLFDVIHTVPNSVIKEIASMFSKIEMFVGCKKTEEKSNNGIKMTAFYITSYIFLTTFPFFVAIVLLVNYDTIYTYEQPSNSMMEQDESIHLLLYVFSVHEYHLLKSHKTVNTSTKPQISFRNTCIHELFQYDGKKLVPEIKEMELLSDILSQIVGGLLSIISFILFVLYVIECIDTMKLFNGMHQMMRYIPESALKANPVLHVITRGILLSNEKVDEFRNNLNHTDFRDSIDICSIKIDESGNFLSIEGKIDDFIGFVPNNISELITCLISRTPEAEKQINSYFTERTGQARSVSFDGKKEVTISFSNKKDEFFIADNSDHFQMNQLIRKMQIIKYPNQLKSEPILNPFVALFEEVPYETLNPFRENFIISDRRNIVLVIDTENNVGNQKKFISQIKSILLLGKCSVCNVGSLWVLGSKVMFPFAKGRVYGSCYEAAKQIMKLLKPGQIALPASFFETELLTSFEFHGSDLSLPLVVLN